MSFCIVIHLLKLLELSNYAIHSSLHPFIKAYDIKRKFTMLRLEERKNSARIYIGTELVCRRLYRWQQQSQIIGFHATSRVPQSVAIDAQARSPAPNLSLQSG